MTGEARRVSDGDLHAYLDGRLPKQRRAEVEAHLAAVPADAEKVAAWGRLNGELHALFDPELDRPLPEEWTEPRPRSAWRAWRGWHGARAMASAAAVMLFVVGGAAGWVAREATTTVEPTAVTSTPIVYYAARAHEAFAQEVRHAVEVPGDQEEHLVRWLSNRLGAPVRAPHLGDIGYKLMGGRLLPSGHTLAAQFMYEDRSGARLTLYVKSGMKTNSETAFRYEEQGDVAVFFWIDGPLGYALAGQVSRENLLRVARVVHTQLEQH